MQSIREYFVGAGGKYLSTVDTPSGSNQSEIGKASAFEGFLGNEKRSQKIGNPFAAKFIRISDDEEETLVHEYSASWYDSREKKEGREPEWRIYYGRNNPVMQMASQGDLCIVALRPDGSLIVVVSPSGSSAASQLAALFDIPEPDRSGSSGTLAHLRTGLDAFSKRLLEEMDIRVEAETTGQLDVMLRQFDGLPDTMSFSTFARKTVKDVDPVQDPDHALISWFEWEDKLFRELESCVVEKEVQTHLFNDQDRVNVEALTNFFLGVHNRRKSRAGHAFAHHIRAMLSANDILFESEVKTEDSKKLDFMLPSGDLYGQKNIPQELLTALGAKTSCKDRWRQVLSEAHMIKDKHLITLESRISGNQLDEMASERLQLVIPKGRHWTFEGSHRQRDPLSIDAFIGIVREREARLRRDHPVAFNASIKAAEAREANRSKARKRQRSKKARAQKE